MSDPDRSSGPDRGRRHRPKGSFTSTFFQEMFRNALLLVVLLACVATAAFVGQAVRDDGFGALGGMLTGLVVGVLLARRIHRTWR